MFAKQICFQHLDLGLKDIIYLKIFGANFDQKLAHLQILS